MTFGLYAGDDGKLLSLWNDDRDRGVVHRIVSAGGDQDGVGVRWSNCGRASAATSASAAGPTSAAAAAPTTTAARNREDRKQNQAQHD